VHAPAIALLALGAAAPAATRPAEDPRPVAFVGVAVVTTDPARGLLDDHTVLVRDGRIEAVGPAGDVALAEDVLVVDGRGRFLTAGLADMHVHTWEPDQLLLFVASGVTTVRNMFGAPLTLRWREEIERGELVGPNLVSAGPIVDGKPPVWPGSSVVETAEDAQRVVAEQVDAGYDFIKVYARLTPDAYDAVLAAARARDIPVHGHVPAAVGLERVLASGQRSIEHLDACEGPLECDDSPLRGKADFVSRFSAWQHVDPERFPILADALREAGVWSCPTEIVMQRWLAAEESEPELERPALRWVAPSTVRIWTSMSALRNDRAEEVRAGSPNRLAFVAALHAEGARLLVGTDTGNPWVVPGFALHEELANFVAAGIPPADVLRIATADAAEFLGQADEFGGVAPGLRADLVLVDGDPREDLAALARPAGVMVRGRWYDRAELERRLAELAAKVAEDG
jgi:imidazolonepropionase-like amidohydrolase